MGGRRWTEEEEAVLKKHYFSRGAKYCASSTSRSARAVHLRAHKLGIRGNTGAVSLVDKKFGRLVVLERVEDHTQPCGARKSMWKCRCGCGKKVVAQGVHLTSGHTKSCGCYRKEMAKETHFIDLTGKKFGRLTVLKRVEDYTSPSGGKATQWECRCECKKIIIVSGAHLTTGHTLSCGCYFKGVVSGENHYNWKGGVTPFALQVRDSPQYRQWRVSVFEQDSYTCQVSGELGCGNLNAHHIKPFHKILEENSIETFEQALECEELWDIDNGITLSEEWHSQTSENELAFHRVYGTRSFTEEDFYEWLNRIRGKV